MVIIRILQPFLCFFFHQDLIIYFFNLLNFYPVTRFLVTRYCVALFSNTPHTFKNKTIPFNWKEKETKETRKKS